jgi:hypothetical protein
MDVSVLQEAKDVWFDEIIELLDGLKIPDVQDASGNYMKDNVFNIEGRVDEVNFTTDLT